jgi:hypothetical protein
MVSRTTYVSRHRPVPPTHDFSSPVWFVGWFRLPVWPRFALPLGRLLYTYSRGRYRMPMQRRPRRELCD